LETELNSPGFLQYCIASIKTDTSGESMEIGQSVTLCIVSIIHLSVSSSHSLTDAQQSM
jgi:hypothetical protein